jgi:hypothetical protein
MLFKEIISVCYGNLNAAQYQFCGQNAGLLNYNRVVHVLKTVLGGFRRNRRAVDGVIS